MSVPMIDPNQPSSTENQQQWQGCAEFDRALHENLLMEYRLRKSWADPWGRRLTIVGVTVICAVFGFLAGALAGLW